MAYEKQNTRYLVIRLLFLVTLNMQNQTSTVYLQHTACKYDFKKKNMLHIFLSSGGSKGSLWCMGRILEAVT